MESLGRCRCLLGSSQRISKPGDGLRLPVSYTHLDVYKRQLRLLLDLPVFHFKLPLQLSLIHI